MSTQTKQEDLVDDLVSIITPAYKAASVVGETIQSVIDQTYPNWELLIADDCSPDDTREVVKRWAEKDPRVKLIECERNGGPAAARNAALERARGRWVAFLDSDDLWRPLKLERAIDVAKSRGSPFVFTGFRMMDSNAERVGSYIAVPRSLTYRQLLSSTAIATSTVLIDRAVVGDVHMRATYYDDYDCWLRILKRDHVAAGLDEDLMRYRMMPNSVSRNKFHSSLQIWRAYRQLEGLGRMRSAWYFSIRTARAFRKYSTFYWRS